jgi:hypothetical protein
MAGELLNLRLRHIVTELRNLDRLLSDRQRHTGVMRSIAKNFDAREMLRLSNELETEARSLEFYLSALIGSGRSAAATAGNRPPQEIAPGRFTPSMGGEIAEVRALSSKLPQWLSSLAKEVSKFRSEANTALNDPGRYGMPRCQTP